MPRKVEPTLREQLLACHHYLTDKAVQLMNAKNIDYASSDDPFRNFRMFGGLGIIVRMSDKLARLRTFEENGNFAVKSESVEDVCLDLINYAVLYLAYKQQAG